MQPLRSADLRHRVTIRRATETDNGRGGYATGWSDLDEVSAEVASLDGRESVMDQVLQGISVYRVRIRWRGDVQAADQLRSEGSCFAGKDVNIRSAVDPDGRREQLVIIADTASTRSS
jgi:SPP1 family predicted phage head-tail adaptor